MGWIEFRYPISELSFSLLSSSFEVFELKFGMLCSFCPYQFVVLVHSSHYFEHQWSYCSPSLLWSLGMYRVLPLVCLMAFCVFIGSSTTTATMTATTASIAICTTWVLWSKWYMKHTQFCALTLQFLEFTSRMWMKSLKFELTIQPVWGHILHWLEQELYSRQIKCCELCKFVVVRMIPLIYLTWQLQSWSVELLAQSLAGQLEPSSFLQTLLAVPCTLQAVLKA